MQLCANQMISFDSTSTSNPTCLFVDCQSTGKNLIIGNENVSTTCLRQTSFALDLNCDSQTVPGVCRKKIIYQSMGTFIRFLHEFS